ncbi:MAG: Tyrosyl-DNA phosphodiesterase 2 [Paramarteilia canceri]
MSIAKNYSKLSEDFVQKTATDSACAMYFLQKNDWEIEEAISDFKNSNIFQSKKISKPSPNLEKDFEKDFSILTWNIDGLDERSQKSRFSAVLLEIESLKPTVIHLQEVTETFLELFRSSNLALLYLVVEPEICDRTTYFVCTLYSKDIELITIQYICYEKSVMGRGMLICNFQLNNEINLLSLNTHLESTSQYSGERIAQLAKAIKNISSVSFSNVDMAFIAGDLNLREKEVVQNKNLFLDLNDSWVESGKDASTQFTWDTKLNHNSMLNNKSFKIRMRMDRIYFKIRDKSQIVQKSFNLCGKIFLKASQLFPSDHFGIFSVFKIIK